MKSKIFAASLIAFVAAATGRAQSDIVRLQNGTVIKGVEVVSYDIRSLRYKRGGATESVDSDQVAKVELGKFEDVFQRGLESPGVMLTQAREQQKQKNDLLAQLAFLHAARVFFDQGADAEAISTLNELQKAYPEGGTAADVFRLKFEYYMGLGRKGQASAIKVAKQYETTAIGNAWPNGFAVEAAFFQALSEQSNAEEFQKKLRDVISRARGVSDVVFNRANVELAHSLRSSNKAEEAKRIYESIANKDTADDSSRAGAYLGLGLLKLDAGGKENAKEALLLFLRVRLETRNAWPSLHAEALFHAVAAARKWQGPEYRYIMGRCRSILLNEFPNSQWARQLK